MSRRQDITSARYQMICDIITPSIEAITSDTTGGDGGEWVWQQDPESGALVQIWIQDDPSTPTIEGLSQKDVPLFAEGFYDGGIRVAGTTERFSDIYENIDFVNSVFASSTRITKRDRVTNIRNARSGEVLWKEEEMPGSPPTTFNVMGVIPVLFLGRVVEKSVMLSRVDVQNG